MLLNRPKCQLSYPATVCRQHLHETDYADFRFPGFNNRERIVAAQSSP